MRSSFLLAVTAAVALASTSSARAQAPPQAPIPPSYQTVVVGGATYSRCGSTWYMPQMQGTSITYIVVAPPS
ncbi:MAG TPA: hypothetical protein VNN06_10175 [Ramlibacter sp.]|nr:hypothetical protein [Ramlibacter sp.]